MSDSGAPKAPKRECGSCAKCCEGWLAGTAHGKPFWPGRPCHYLQAGKCSIYKDRPKDPCEGYTCQWLANPEIPGWLKPDEVNAIITLRTVDGIEYLSIEEAGSPLRADVLSWAIMYCMSNGKNLRYMLNGGTNKIGAPEFVKSRA